MILTYRGTLRDYPPSDLGIFLWHNTDGSGFAAGLGTPVVLPIVREAARNMGLTRLLRLCGFLRSKGHQSKLKAPRWEIREFRGLR
jgi:hypothetical protein